MGFRIREFSRDYLLYPEFGADKDRDDIQGGGSTPSPTPPGPEPLVYDPTDEGNYIWIVDNDEATIIYFLGGTQHPRIPDTLDGYPVVAIAATAFNYSDVDRVAMSNNITIVD